MSKPLKQLLTDHLRGRYAGVDSACVVDLTGLDVGATTRFRQLLRSKSVRVEVVKNSMARRAFEGSPLAPLGDSLAGPCALVTCGDSIIEVAKLLVEAAREYTAVTLKQAMIEGDPRLLTVEEVARFKSLRELMGEVAMLMSSPGRRVAGCIVSPQSRIAGCLKALAGGS
jgi:large subunit ribosomal protein L10